MNVQILTCPRCNGKGCYHCGYSGELPSDEALMLEAEDDCDDEIGDYG